MKLLASLAIAALSLVTPARAGAFAMFNLAQGTCWGAGGDNTARFACDGNSGTVIDAYGSVIVPVALPAFVGVTTIMEIRVAGAVLPAWWLTQVGGCRAGAIFEDFSPANMDGACLDLWGGVAPLSVTTIENAVGGANRLRIHGAATLPSELSRQVGPDGTTEFNVFRLVISKARSAGPGACAGCTSGACIVLNEMTLIQAGGAGNHRTNIPAGNLFIVYNGGIGIGHCPPDVEPTRNRTWGAVKALYR